MGAFSIKLRERYRATPSRSLSLTRFVEERKNQRHRRRRRRVTCSRSQRKWVAENTIGRKRRRPRSAAGSSIAGMCARMASKQDCRPARSIARRAMKTFCSSRTRCTPRPSKAPAGRKLYAFPFCFRDNKVLPSFLTSGYCSSNGPRFRVVLNSRVQWNVMLQWFTSSPLASL